MDASGNLAVKVNGTTVHTDSLADYSDDGKQIYVGLLKPRTDDATNTWSAQIDYVRIDPTLAPMLEIRIILPFDLIICGSAYIVGKIEPKRFISVIFFHA